MTSKKDLDKQDIEQINIAKILEPIVIEMINSTTKIKNKKIEIIINNTF